MSLLDSKHLSVGVPPTQKLDLLFNVCMDNLSLHRQAMCCSVGGTVVNHMLYAGAIVLFAPSAKCLQKLLGISHTYG